MVGVGVGGMLNGVGVGGIVNGVGVGWGVAVGWGVGCGTGWTVDASKAGLLQATNARPTAMVPRNRDQWSFNRFNRRQNKKA